MTTSAKLVAVAATVLVVAVVACQSVPGSGGIGSPPTAAPSPSPALLASGTFRFPPMGAAVELVATGEGSNVAGTMKLSGQTSFTVDLKCALMAEDGRILIGGDTTESTFADVPTGTRAAIVLKRGSPAQAVFAWQGSDPPAPSCMAFLEDMSAGTVHLAPIDGTVELRP